MCLAGWPCCCRDGHPMAWAELPGSPCCTRSLWAALALQSASWECSGAGLCTSFPLHDHKSSSQPALAPVAANPDAHMCVHMLYPRAVPGAQLQSPVMGHCSAGEGLAQARADSAAVQRCSTLARREVQTVKRGDALTEGCRRSCCSVAGDAAASSGN